ncbi:hypothetical protein MMC22_002692 [Lobaria immixta]|nr:hypothetical protein [Lobaria immixta]
MAESTITASTPGTPTSLLVASVTLPNTPASVVSTGSEVAKFLKPDSPRKRRRSAADLSSPTDTVSLRASPLSISPKHAFPQYHPRPLTGAAAMAEGKRQREEDEKAESRRTSPNPARNAIGALLGTQSGDTSKPQDVTNVTTTLSEPVAAATASIKVPEISHGDNTLQTSPVSMSSGGTSESTTVGAMNTNGASVASPGQIDESMGDEDETASRHCKNGTLNSNAADPEEGRSNKAMTFPGPLLSAQGTDARRGMSLPHSGLGSPRSPSAVKKHKCPYCSTDFTRHHNLKSHLLTHSHEKPYLCETCDSRFRRLHDLKRHTKLHTGERPHVCPKCDRSFARGDALARHNKGQGGCAGRRSSMGSFGGDDKSEGRRKSTGQDDSMPGLMYTGEASHEPERMDEDSESVDARGTSLPSIRKHDAPSEPHHRQRLSESHTTYQPRQTSTYPPVAARQPSGGLYPPSASHGGGSSTSTTPGAPSSLNQYPPSAGSGSSTFQAPGPNAFSQGGMTESPKPLSPGGHPDSAVHPNRSPSLTQQFQQTQYGRRPNAHNTSPPMGLPPPITGPNHQNVPHLPSLPGLTPPDSRFTLHSQAPGPTLMHPGAQGNLSGPAHPISGGGVGSPGYHSQVGNNTSSANNSLSSHGTGPHANGDHSIYGAGSSDRLWAYVRSLETKVDRLQDEVTTLKSQFTPPQPHR